MITAIVGFILAFLIIAGAAIVFAIGGIFLIWLITFMGIAFYGFCIQLLFGG